VSVVQKLVEAKVQLIDRTKNQVKVDGKRKMDSSDESERDGMRKKRNHVRLSKIHDESKHAEIIDPVDEMEIEPESPVSQSSIRLNEHQNKPRSDPEVCLLLLIIRKSKKNRPRSSILHRINKDISISPKTSKTNMILDKDVNKNSKIIKWTNMTTTRCRLAIRNRYDYFSY
jgi:hypothetical protein